MHKPPRHQIDLLKKTAVDWIAEKRFDLFVTLAFNNGRTPITRTHYLSPLVQRDRLRAWDARVNHMLLGKRWSKDRLNRIWCFYVLEKPQTNPHWHLLLRFDAGAYNAEHNRMFRLHAGSIWNKLVPPGSVDIQAITDHRGAVEYVAKTWGYELSFSDVILPDSF